MGTFPGKERLSLNRAQRNHLSNQSKHRINRKKSRNLLDPLQIEQACPRITPNGF